MTNTSATGGILVSAVVSGVVTSPEGQALVTFLQNQLTGITGISGTLIRPRWQPDPPILPAASVDWIAFGITKKSGQAFAFVEHIAVAGTPPVECDVVVRSEDFDILCSVYGPNADLNASLIREGFSVAQNREALTLNGIGFTSAGDITPVPALVNDIWYYRTDLTLSFRRLIRRVYPVLDILSATGTIRTDIPNTTRPFNVTAT